MSDEYHVFKEDNKKHLKVGEVAEKVLQDGEELDTKTLAEKVAESGSSFEESYIKSLLTDGSNYYAKNFNIRYEPRPEGSGGNNTFYWRLDK